MRSGARHFYAYFVVLALLFLAIGVFSICNSAAQEDWPQFCKNPQHTGFTSSPAPDDAEALWIFNTSGAIVSSPAVANGMVYVGSYDGKLYALNMYTGEPLWTFETGGAIESSPLVADGVVYIGSFDKNLYAINASTGSEIWNYSTNGNIHAPPLLWKGKIFINSWDGIFYAINASNGEKAWNYTTGDVQGSAAAWGEMVLEGGCDHILRNLNISTGDLIWEFDSGSHIASSPTIFEGKVYIGNHYNKMFCINLTTGEELWNFTLEDWTRSTASIGYGKIFFGGKDAKIRALGAETGQQIWEFVTNGAVDASPSIADGKVFVGSSDGIFYALNASNGDLNWSYLIGGEITSSAAIHDGKLYTASSNGKLYCLAVAPLQITIDTEGTTQVIKVGKGVRFDHKGGEHTVILTNILTNITADTIILHIRPKMQTINISVDELVNLDTDGNGKYDLSITLNSVNRSEGSASLMFKALDESDYEDFLTGIAIDAEGSTHVIKLSEGVKFNHKEKVYGMILTHIAADNVTLEINSTTQIVVIVVGEEKNVDTDGNGKNDLSITLGNVNTTAKTASLTLRPITEPQDEDMSVLPLFIIMMIIVVIIILAVVVMALKR